MFETLAAFLKNKKFSILKDTLTIRGIEGSDNIIFDSYQNHLSIPIGNTINICIQEDSYIVLDAYVSEIKDVEKLQDLLNRKEKINAINIYNENKEINFSICEILY
ncbi:MAG TPA: hypothetical protein VEZ91_11960 [Kurthia gibsonii]|nr:hypothetical protein [Kurthia gibsonii]